MQAPEIPYLGRLSARAAAEGDGDEGGVRYRRVTTVQREDGTWGYSGGLGSAGPARPGRMPSEEYLARLRPSLDRQRSSRDNLRAEEDAEEASSYDLMNLSENIRNRQYYVAFDSSALPTVGTRDEIPERQWYRYVWYRDLSNNRVVTGVLRNMANLQRIEHNSTTRDPKVKYRVPNTDWVLKQVANGRSSVPEEFQYRYMWENDVGTLANTKGLQAFYDEGPIARPPAPPQPQPRLSADSAGVIDWRAQVQALQSQIDAEATMLDAYTKTADSATNATLMSIRAGNWEGASGQQRTAKEYLDKVIASQARIEGLKAEKKRLEGTYNTAPSTGPGRFNPSEGQPPPRLSRRFEPSGRFEPAADDTDDDDPTPYMYSTLGSRRGRFGH